jgi:tripartite-type tricarboxylate transporter receptor subunit TctC
MTTFFQRAAIAASSALCAFPFAAIADEFPSKPITLVVPFAAGGPTDAIARMLAEPMSKVLKQTVVVDNTAGAGGTVGANKVAKANNDGYTLLLHHIGHATAVSLYRKLPYDTVADFQAIGLINEVPMTFVTRKNLPVNDFKGLVDYVQKNVKTVNMANAGIGSASHLCGMLFQSAVKADLTPIPYKGTGPAMNDLLGGQIDFMCDQTTNTTGQIRGGAIKALAVTTRARVPSLKELPTAAEAGLPGFEVAVWQALYAPKGTPKPVVDKLVAALQAALADPRVKEKMADLGTEPVTANRATPDYMTNYLKQEIAKWSPIIKAAGVYAD